MNNDAKAAELVAMLFLGRDMAHAEHLRVSGRGSFAKHKALGEFYDGVLGLADTFAETYQGKYQVLLDIPLLENEFTGGINEVLRSQVDWIDANRDEVCDYRPLQNVIDEICAFYHQKLYLLDNLE